MLGWFLPLVVFRLLFPRSLASPLFAVDPVQRLVEERPCSRVVPVHVLVVNLSTFRSIFVFFFMFLVARDEWGLENVASFIVRRMLLPPFTFFFM